MTYDTSFDDAVATASKSWRAGCIYSMTCRVHTWCISLLLIGSIETYNTGHELRTALT